MAVPVINGARFSPGTPVALFQTSPRQPVSYLDIFTYDVSRDGQKFLINTDVKPAESARMAVVLNLTAKTKQMKPLSFELKIGLVSART